MKMLIIISVLVILAARTTGNADHVTSLQNLRDFKLIPPSIIPTSATYPNVNALHEDDIKPTSPNDIRPIEKYFNSPPENDIKLIIPNVKRHVEKSTKTTLPSVIRLLKRDIKFTTSSTIPPLEKYINSSTLNIIPPLEMGINPTSPNVSRALKRDIQQKGKGHKQKGSKKGKSTNINVIQPLEKGSKPFIPSLNQLLEKKIDPTTTMNIPLLEKDIKPITPIDITPLEKDMNSITSTIITSLENDVKPTPLSIIPLLKKDTKPTSSSVSRSLKKGVKKSSTKNQELKHVKNLEKDIKPITSTILTPLEKDITSIPLDIIPFLENDIKPTSPKSSQALKKGKKTSTRHRETKLVKNLEKDIKLTTSSGIRPLNKGSSTATASIVPPLENEINNTTPNIFPPSENDSRLTTTNINSTLEKYIEPVPLSTIPSITRNTILHQEEYNDTITDNTLSPQGKEIESFISSDIPLQENQTDSLNLSTILLKENENKTLDFNTNRPQDKENETMNFSTTRPQEKENETMNINTIRPQEKEKETFTPSSTPNPEKWSELAALICGCENNTMKRAWFRLNNRGSDVSFLKSLIEFHLKPAGSTNYASGLRQLFRNCYVCEFFFTACNELPDVNGDHECKQTSLHMETYPNTTLEELIAKGVEISPETAIMDWEYNRVVRIRDYGLMDYSFKTKNYSALMHPKITADVQEVFSEWYPTDGLKGRSKRQVMSTCLIPSKELFHSELNCSISDTEVTCLQKCEYGYTLPVGTFEEKSCSHKEDLWMPGNFEDCKPFVDCTIRLINKGSMECQTASVSEPVSCKFSCAPFQNWTAVENVESSCNIEGWKPALPHCALGGSGLALVPRYGQDSE